jgi:hypothetical protein
MLSLKHNFVFIHIPKTGGNSIQTVIEPFTEDFRLKEVPEHDLLNRFAVYGPITSNKHCTSAEYIEKLGFEGFMKLKRVAFVRHPLDRALSMYFSPHRWTRRLSGSNPIPYRLDKQEFTRVVNKMKTATTFMRYKTDVIAFDFVGRYENFDDDFRKMLSVCGLPPCEGAVPHYNKGNADKMTHCDQEVIGMVKEKFAEDFINFGYDPA